MKGPSLDAIRRFKEQQEQKKREEDEKRISQKLSTLEHRAAQGDRKAKIELKKIEKIKERSKNPEPPPRPVTSKPPTTNSVQPGSSKTKPNRPPAKVETNFEELMRLAKQNKNEIRKPVEPKPVELPRARKPKKVESKVDSKPVVTIPAKPSVGHRTVPQISHQLIRRSPTRRPQALSHAPVRHKYYDDYDEDEDEEEDDYEQDDFVVKDDEEDVQAELSKTLKSVFHYDRRRCDLREEELDRQYRAIGKVSTFEDLEREERRASRLAAAEDARAQREEEERKRLKKIRLKNSR